MWDTQVIVFEGEADQSPDHAAGDVHFKIVQLPHSRFIRKGDNLYVKHTIKLSEALIGFDYSIKHLDGATVGLSRKGVTPPGFVQKLKGLGMPKHEFSHESGDLFVEYQILFPAILTPEQISTVKTLF